MPSFLVRNLARIFAASVMEKRSISSSSAPSTPNYVAEGVSAWNKYMRWLIPFVQASGYSIVIENPKSHEKTVIDKDTKEFSHLSSSWLKRYDKNELSAWKAKEKEKEKKYKKVRKIAEARGRAKFGDGYKITNKDIQEVLNNSYDK